MGLSALFAVLALWVSGELVGRPVAEGPLAVCSADYGTRSAVLFDAEEAGASAKEVREGRAEVLAEFNRCKRRARDEGWKHALASILVLGTAALLGWRAVRKGPLVPQ